LVRYYERFKMGLRLPFTKTLEIFNAYNANGGNYSKTAKELGIDQRTVKKYVKFYHENYSFMADEATRTGIPIDRVSHYWLKTKNEKGDDISVFVKNKDDIIPYEEIREKLIEDMKSFSPNVSNIHKEKKGNHLLVLDPADVHIGKLCIQDEVNVDYNINKSTEALVNSSKTIIDKAKSSYNLSNICIVIGNDIIHVDNPKNQTTRGTPQDVDGKWWQMFEAARRSYIEIISYASKIAPVNIIFCPSNHDLVLGFALTDAIYCYFYNDENVNVSEYGKSPRHRKYMRFGNNLLGFTHGDGAKNKDLSTLMQFEAREEWSNTKFSYWYVHHHHHKNRSYNGVQLEKDLVGITLINTNLINNQDKNTQIECVRSPSPPDYWHSQYGYVNIQAIEGFIHHEEFGQVARLTENLFI